jgi:hypothetical protein
VKTELKAFYSSEDALRDLIQQSQIVQGYAPFDVRELESASRAWRRGLSRIPQEFWISSFQAALEAYESGKFRPAFVRRVYADMNAQTKPVSDADAVRGVERLAKLALGDAPSGARSNVLGPIADWIEKRPGPRRNWEQKVLDAAKPET